MVNRELETGKGGGSIERGDRGGEWVAGGGCPRAAGGTMIILLFRAILLVDVDHSWSTTVVRLKRLVTGSINTDRLTAFNIVQHQQVSIELRYCRTQSDRVRRCVSIHVKSTQPSRLFVGTPEGDRAKKVLFGQEPRRQILVKSDPNDDVQTHNGGDRCHEAKYTSCGLQYTIPHNMMWNVEFFVLLFISSVSSFSIAACCLGLASPAVTITTTITTAITAAGTTVPLHPSPLLACFPGFRLDCCLL